MLVVLTEVTRDNCILKNISKKKTIDFLCTTISKDVNCKIREINILILIAFEEKVSRF